MNPDDHDEMISLAADVRYIRERVDAQAAQFGLLMSRMESYKTWQDRIGGAVALLGSLAGCSYLWAFLHGRGG